MLRSLWHIPSAELVREYNSGLLHRHRAGASMSRASLKVASLGLLFVLSHATVATAAPLSCAQLASQNYNKEGVRKLPANKNVLSVTSQVVAATGSVPEYCQVDLLLDTDTRVRVGLPTTTWNGEVDNLGAGGFYGTVKPVTSAIQLGYVGSTTNGGHDARDLFDSSWALNSKGTLAKDLIRDYATYAHQAQYQWALKLTELFYGKKAQRNYFDGCSDGGRVSMLMAQLFPDDFDGVVVGAPTINFDRYMASTLYPLVAENIENHANVSNAKLDAVTAAAIAHCDALDGVSDGIINDERVCNYNANAFVCKGTPSAPVNCLSPSEAAAVNRMWDGPRDKKGRRIWFGIPRGAHLTPLAGAGPEKFPNQYFTYWLYQNRSFRYKALTYARYLKAFSLSEAEYHSIIGTDNPNLEAFRRRGGKIIMYHGLYDGLVVPGGSYSYYDQVLEAMGGKQNTQDFFRFFPIPGARHCGSHRSVDWFGLLTRWVEQGTEPVPVATYSNGVTRPLCAYPTVVAYSGSGNTNAASNFTCVPQDPSLLAADSVYRNRKLQFRQSLSHCRRKNATAGHLCPLNH